MDENTLIFRHLPAELSKDERKDMLFNFGATRVRVMGLSGPMKNTAFAVFPSKDHATEVLHQLHQASLLGSRLVVEFAKSHSDTPSLLHGNQRKTTDVKDSKSDGKSDDKERTLMEQRAIKYDTAFATWGLKHPRRPVLRYRYPPPSPSILSNILNTLVAVPKFYVQVLHLMNKMDLPAPFGPVTAAPPLVGQVPMEKQPDDLGQREMEISDTDESEINSEGEETTQRLEESKSRREHARRKTLKRLASAKRPRLSEFQSDNISSQLPVTANIPIENVFEQIPDLPQAPKKIALKISTSHDKVPTPHQRVGATEDTQWPVQDSHHERLQHNTSPIPSHASSSAPGFNILGDEVECPQSTNAQDQQHSLFTAPASSDHQNISSPSLDTGDGATIQTDNTGFGIIQAVSKVPAPSEEAQEKDDDNGAKQRFISSSALKRGRLSKEEMQEYSVFRRYAPGEMSCRLYIKNLSRQVTEEDVRYIFGRYVNWDSETEVNMFDVRLMKEGRMKGQAFVTLPSEDVAVEAVSATNGFVLKDKPLVVQFARSAKAQEDAAAIKP